MSAIVPVILPSIQRALPANGDDLALNPDFCSPAITRCCNAWKTVYAAERARGTPGVSCYLRANEAYRYAMPPLTSAKNIRDYIACVAHGMMARTIDMIVAPRLIAIAQVAVRARRPAPGKKLARSKDPGKSRQTRAQSASRPPKSRKK